MSSTNALQIRRRLGRDDWTPPAPYGPDGWSFTHQTGAGSVIVTCADQDDGHDWVHASKDKDLAGWPVWRLPETLAVHDPQQELRGRFGPVIASFPSMTERQVVQTVVNDFRLLVERGHGRAARGARLSSPEYEDVTYPSVDDIRAELAGRDLACLCPIGLPCHADVLLEIANPDR
jgi:hypothetical protein